MTKGDFLKEFGADFRKVAGKPMFAALLQMIDAESPAKKLSGKSENDRLHGAAVFLSEIKGWEDLRAMIVGLSAAPDKDREVPDTFDTPEEI